MQSNLAATTTRDEFLMLAAEHRVVPVTRKVLADSETPLSAYRKLAASRPGTFLFESAENGRSWSRWSFIGAGSPSALTVRDDEAVVARDASTGRAVRGTHCTHYARRWACCRPDPCRACRLCLAGWSDSSPMTSFVGWNGCRSWRLTTWGLPDMLLMLATDLAAFDHHEGTITLIANAVNWDGSNERVDMAYEDAVARLDVMTEALGQPLESTVATFSTPAPAAPRAMHGGGIRRGGGAVGGRNRGW